MKISKDSWHYRVAALYGGRIDDVLDGYWKERELSPDFCGYTRKFLWGCCRIVFITLLSILFGYPIFIEWVIAALAGLGPFGGELNGVGLKIIMILVVFALFLFTCVKIQLYFDAKKYERLTSDQEPNHGFLVTWYKSIKDKYCPIIKYED